MTIFKEQLFQVIFKFCVIKIPCGIWMEKKPHKAYTQNILGIFKLSSILCEKLYIDFMYFHTNKGLPLPQNLNSNLSQTSKHKVLGKLLANPLPLTSEMPWASNISTICLIHHLHPMLPYKDSYWPHKNHWKHIQPLNISSGYH